MPSLHHRSRRPFLQARRSTCLGERVAMLGGPILVRMVGCLTYTSECSFLCGRSGGGACRSCGRGRKGSRGSAPRPGGVQTLYRCALTLALPYSQKPGHPASPVGSSSIVGEYGPAIELVRLGCTRLNERSTAVLIYSLSRVCVVAWCCLLLAGSDFDCVATSLF